MNIFELENALNLYKLWPEEFPKLSIDFYEESTELSFYICDEKNVITNSICFNDDKIIFYNYSSMKVVNTKVFYNKDLTSELLRQLF